MLNPDTLAASVTAAAMALADGRSEEEIALLVAALHQLSHTLETIALARLRIEHLQQPRQQGVGATIGGETIGTTVGTINGTITGTV